jgi:uncharacterized protein YbaA (DUF1428 family)
MPRRKSCLEEPIHLITFIDDQGEECVIEVWQTYPNKGARGAHKRKTRSEASDIAFEWISYQYYFSSSNGRREVMKRSLYDPRFNRELVSQIRSVCTANKIFISRSTIYEVARDVKKAIKAMDNALAKYLPRVASAQRSGLAMRIQ